MIPVLLPGQPHGQRSLAGHSPWGCKESDTTQRLGLHACTSKLDRCTREPSQPHTMQKPDARHSNWRARYLLSSCATKDSLTAEERNTQSLPKKPFDAKKFTLRSQKCIF